MLVAAQVMQITQTLLNEYNAGVTVTAVNLGDVQPPAEVANAFAEVVRAGQNQQAADQRSRPIQEPETPLAEGEAAKLIEDAKATRLLSSLMRKARHHALLQSMSSTRMPKT